ncbi:MULTISPECIES: YceI family protein [Streptacidiphilus]|uniref:YceI family protein n=1 Tax=Streptacidiphilus cavernicola TaxID=3342716 RepID=A0ABV6V0J2_9ACTN|nr:YceI family protein [Streptacidiphilus jeojiense]
MKIQPMTKTGTPVPVTVPPAGAYVIDPSRSTIDFTTKHMFGLGTVTGTFTLRSGRITVATPTIASGAVVVADAASFSSGHRGRDEKVLSGAFLDSASYPEINFASAGAVNIDGRWTLRGTLTAHGEDAPVEFTVIESAVEGGTLRVVATATVDRHAHGITAMKGMAGRYLQLTATVHAHQ